MKEILVALVVTFVVELVAVLAGLVDETERWLRGRLDGRRRR